MARNRSCRWFRVVVLEYIALARRSDRVFLRDLLLSARDGLTPKRSKLDLPGPHGKAACHIVPATISARYDRIAFLQHVTHIGSERVGKSHRT